MNGSNDIVRRLERAWTRERIFFGARGFFYLVLWVTLLFAADFVLDYAFRLPGRIRLLLLFANGAILAGVLYWTWLRRLKHYDSLRVSLQVERLYPELGSILVSYVQFSGQTGDETMSPALVEAMRRQAVEESKPLDFGKIVRFRTLKYISMTALLVVALAFGAGYAWPRHLEVFMVRLVNPGVDARYPTRTTIDIDASSRDIVVQQGRTVLLRAVVGGVLPEQARLTIIPDQGRADTVTIPATAAAAAGKCEFVYRVEDAYRGFSYAFRAGDDSSPRYSVVVIPPPVVEPKVELQYPQYCGRKPERLETLSFEALEGSRIVWVMKADRPLKAAEMIREDGSPLAMTLSANGLSATATVKPEKTFSYGFRWTDKQHKFVYEPDVRYSINVVADLPPRVALLSPARDETVTTRKAVDLLFQADDDYGVVSARIFYKLQTWADQQKTESEEKEVPIKTLAKGESELRESFRWDVKSTIPGLKAGDTVTYGVEVRDSREGKPGTGRSSTRRLTVVSDEDYIRMAGERRRDLLEKIKDLYQQEGKAAEAVQTLKGKE